MVMMMAITPSLNAVSRSLFTTPLCRLGQRVATMRPDAAGG
jgi:hypothetical protein